MSDPYGGAESELDYYRFDYVNVWDVMNPVVRGYARKHVADTVEAARKAAEPKPDPIPARPYTYWEYFAPNGVPNLDTSGLTGGASPSGTVLPDGSITITGAPTGGTFTLVVDGQRSAPIPYNATVVAIKEGDLEPKGYTLSDLMAMRSKQWARWADRVLLYGPPVEGPAWPRTDEPPIT